MQQQYVQRVVVKTGNFVCTWCALLLIIILGGGVVDFFFAYACLLCTAGSTTTAAAVQGQLFAKKEGLSGMSRAARFAEDTAVFKLGVREHGGLKGRRSMACRRKIRDVQIGYSLDKGTVHF